jgi:hypothetical protein
VKAKLPEALSWRRLRHLVADLFAAALGTAGAGLETYAVVSGPTTRLNLYLVDLSQGRQIGLGITLIGAGALRAVLIRWRLDGLESANDALNHLVTQAGDRERGAWRLAEELLKAMAWLIIHETGLWSDDRVSFFIEDPRRRGLLLTTRASRRATYATDQDHGLYDYGVGCLGEAWDGGSVYVDDLPNPESQTADWQNALLNDWAIPLEASAAMTMKSRTVFAQRVDAGLGQRWLGVVVVESTKVPETAEDAISQTKLVDYFAGKQDFISRLFQLATELHAAREAVTAEQTSPSLTSRVRSLSRGVVAKLAGAFSSNG